MTIIEMRELFAYGAWANAVVFEAAAGLSAERLSHLVESSFPSVNETLAHIVGVEWVWLRRWLGESPSSIPDWVAKPSLAALRGNLAEVERERDTLLTELTDKDLSTVISYRTLNGQAFSDPLGGLMRHVVNHSTYHRGQVATQLRQLGFKPPGTDLILFLRQSK